MRLSRNDSHAEIVITYCHQTRYMRGDITTRALFNPGRESCATGSHVPGRVGAASVIGFVTTGDHHSAIASTAHKPGPRSQVTQLAHFLNVPGLSPELTTRGARTDANCPQYTFDVVCNRRKGLIAAADQRFAQKRDARMHTRQQPNGRWHSGLLRCLREHVSISIFAACRQH